MSPPPQIDPTLYTWLPYPEDTQHYYRRALAGETLWISRPKSQHELFLYTSLTLTRPISNSHLPTSLKAAWKALRYQFPELVATAAYEDGIAIMKCAVPSSEAEASEWVERTFHFESGEVIGFEGLRSRILVAKGEGRESEQALLMVNANTSDSEKEDRTNQVEIMLNIDHQVTDGIGIRILLDRYLGLLAEGVDRSSETNLRWGESAQNLTPAWVGFLNEKEQALSGVEYERSAKESRDVMFTKLSKNPGLPLLQIPHAAIQESYSITLTLQESVHLNQRLKSIFGANATLTHLGHAAMVLATLRATQETLPQTWHSPCWLNGRRYLNDVQRLCIPNCLSFTPIVFPNVSELILPPLSSDSVAETKEKLMKTCKIATSEYLGIKEQKNVLSSCVSLMEEIGASMWKNKLSGITASQPLAAEPFFLSDGITENYIAHSYPRSTTTSKVFEVDKVHFTANAEKNLIVRMSSWRGQITVSGEWISSDYEREMVVGFLEDVVRIITCILEG